MTLHALGMIGVVYSNSQAGITKEWVIRMVGQALNAKKRHPIKGGV